MKDRISWNKAVADYGISRQAVVGSTVAMVASEMRHGIHNSFLTEMKTILTYITVLLVAFTAFGQNQADSVRAYFRVGHSRLDPSFGGNRQALVDFEAGLLQAISENALDSIVVRAYSSPDGVSLSNVRLSELRCQAIIDHLVQSTGVDRAVISAYPEGIAWTELRALVEANPDMPNRKEVLDILDNVPVWIYGAGGKIVDGRKKRLMDLAGGSAYHWMQDNLFPELRKGVGIAYYVRAASLAEAVNDGEDFGQEVREADKEEVWLDVVENQTDMYGMVELPEQDSIEAESGTESVAPDSVRPRHQRNFIMALKTNMLFDALLVPNVGVEFSLGRNMSVYGEWMYAWWDNDPKHRYWRTYGGDLGFRWWFGGKARSRALSGHHLGVYGGIMTFDVEFGDIGYMGGKPGGTLWDRQILNVGLEYGFSLPVAKRLNIDFSIGVGYLGGNYIKYYPFDNDYYFDKEYNMRFIGPTKAEISLVWLIGRVNDHKRKGGGE